MADTNIYRRKMTVQRKNVNISSFTVIKIFPIWCNVNFVSIFTALNNTKKQRKFNNTPYRENFYQLIYWDKI